MISYVHLFNLTVISILLHYPFFLNYLNKYLTSWHFIHLLDKDIFLKNHDTRIPPIKLIIPQWHLLSSPYSHVPSCLKMSFYLGFVWIRDRTRSVHYIWLFWLPLLCNCPFCFFTPAINLLKRPLFQDKLVAKYSLR